MLALVVERVNRLQVVLDLLALSVEKFFTDTASKAFQALK